MSLQVRNNNDANMRNQLATKLAGAAVKYAVNKVINNTPTQAPTKAPTPGPSKKSGGGKKSGGVISAPVASFVAARGSQPIFRSRTATSTRIQHRELIAGVTGSVAFVATEFPLNPGLTTTFPWLASQASSWEQYKFHSLRFRYYSRCATSNPGSILMVPDYDASDDAPVSEVVACSYRDSVEEVPWTTEFCVSLDTKAMSIGQARKFVRTGALAPNLDIKSYDSGNMFICTVDGTAVNWGKIWVEYDVELFVPQLPPTGFAVVSSLHVRSTNPTTASTLSPPTVAIITGNTDLCTVGTKTLTFLVPGAYLFCWQGTASVSITGISVTGTIVFPATWFTGAAAVNFNAATTVASVYAAFNAVVGSTLILNATFNTGANVEWFVTRIQSDTLMA